MKLLRYPVVEAGPAQPGARMRCHCLRVYVWDGRLGNVFVHRARVELDKLVRGRVHLHREQAIHDSWAQHMAGHNATVGNLVAASQVGGDVWHDDGHKLAGSAGGGRVVVGQPGGAGGRHLACCKLDRSHLNRINSSNVSVSIVMVTCISRLR